MVDAPGLEPGNQRLRGRVQPGLQRAADEIDARTRSAEPPPAHFERDVDPNAECLADHRRIRT
jgi:hypothetical protein